MALRASPALHLGHLATNRSRAGCVKLDRACLTDGHASKQSSSELGRLHDAKLVLPVAASGVAAWRRSHRSGRHRRFAESERGATTSPELVRYFWFILISTAVRSFEAGVIASMMPSIRESLHLSFTSQGNIAGSPDYGIVPSGIVAMAIFKRFSAYSVLTTGYFIIALVAALAALRPSLTTLVAARAVGGLCWGFAAVHYPTWVNTYGPPEKRTMWMAGINAMLLVGIVSGYVVGGISRATGFASWEMLYMLEGLLMLGCALCGASFSQDLVQASGKETETPDPAAAGQRVNEVDTPSRRQGLSLDGILPMELRALCKSRLFMFTLAAGCFQAGSVGFMLYFITQALAAIFHWSPRMIYICVSIVIALGPIGGIVGGARYLSSVGGYRNYSRAHQLTAGCAISSLVCGCCLPFAGGSALFYGAANLGLLLLGAAPTAAINGIAVSAVPEAKHFASGAQFAMQNLAKLVVPLIGGAVIDRCGLVAGYHAVTIGALALYAAAAAAAYRAAENAQHLPDSASQA